MNIKTKYDIGQTVWVIQRHRKPEPISYKIKKIQVRDYHGSLLVEYSFSDCVNSISYEECRLHPTKEACKAATNNK